MERFSYVRASSPEHAVALLNEPGVRSRPLAGGTDLLLLLREEPGLSDRVVDITQIPAMHRIELVADQVLIGAGATFSEIAESRCVQETAPVLVEACREVGAVQIRNMGTLGGNVANAAACADSLPALVCLDALAYAQTPAGEQVWPVADLITGPNRTRLPAGALLTYFSYVAPAPGSRSAFVKLGRRNAMAISRLTVAALGRLDATGRIAEARLAAGSATPQIRRLSGVEAGMVGQVPSEALFAAAGEAAAAAMINVTGRRWSTEYKEPALAALVVAAWRRVFSQE